MRDSRMALPEQRYPTKWGGILQASDMQLRLVMFTVLMEECSTKLQQALWRNLDGI